MSQSTTTMRTSEGTKHPAEIHTSHRTDGCRCGRSKHMEPINGRHLHISLDLEQCPGEHLFLIKGGLNGISFYFHQEIELKYIPGP